MKAIVLNLNLWAAIVGFAGLLIQNINAFVQDAKYKKKIALLKKETGRIKDNEVAKKMELISEISEYEKTRTRSFESNARIVFTILIISFLLQIGGAFQNV